jgi:hypothetical protein
LIIRNFILLQDETLLRKFSPGSILLHFLIAQIVVIGGNIGFERRPALFHALFLQQLVQKCGLGVQLALACLLFQIRETCRGERKRTSPLNVSVRVRHSTLYHIIGMIIIAHLEMLWPRAAAELRSAWTGEGARPHTSKGRRGEPRLYRKIVLGLVLRTDN